MRTWSVSGTAFALCTRSSSLSMSTRTSISGILLLVREGGAATAVREHLLQPARDGLRHELFDISAECRNLFDPARRHETDLRTGHHVDRFDLRSEGSVELVHLEFPFEVRDNSQALDNHTGLPAPGEVDGELAEDVDLDVRRTHECLAQELDPLRHCEHRRLVVRIADDTDHEAVEDLGGTRDHVEMPVRDGIVGAGVDRGDHLVNRVSRAEPYTREVRTSSGGTSGAGSRDDVS